MIQTESLILYNWERPSHPTDHLSCQASAEALYPDDHSRILATLACQLGKWAKDQL